jgi:hypothetical protein
MLFHPTKEIFCLKPRLKSLLVVLLLTISFFWSLDGAFAQYTVTATKTYNSNGTFTITDLSDITGFDPTNEIFAVANVDILIVGGGGGGGRGSSAGGGGGGQVLLQTIDLNLGATLNITIGQGGAGARQLGNNSNNGQAGGNTGVNLISGATSINYSANGGQGGAGNGNAGANGNGNAGGSANGNGQNAKGGGGGGADGPGTNGSGTGASSTGGNGGNGVNISITGGRYGAGGGGNSRNGGIGGLGGGGNANPSGQGGNALPDTGSGGGAGRAPSTGGNGSDGIVVVQIVYRILPVEFLFFNAIFKPNDRSASLEWETAKEWDNSHFEIERAVNIIKDWKTVGRVEGNGYSDEPISYRFNDTDLLAIGGNVFYRIKQVDFNGNYSFSKTKAIQIPFPKESQEAWIAFPNPNVVGSETNIKLVKDDLYNDETIYLRILNSFGQSNFETVSSPEELTFLVSNWMKNKPSGIYILDIQWGNHSQQIKLFRE